jgi:Right handed beta helix region
MKRQFSLLSLVLPLLAAASEVFASTTVPPTLVTDAQWDASGNPYIIQGRVTVAKGATLRVGPNVRILFQGAAALEVDGSLEVQGSAAAPAVFDMTQGGLGSELFINGGQADFLNVKILSGVFLAQDAQLAMEGAAVTKGSGIYLKGATSARIKNCKIYGNATGLVLDGQVRATLEFDTLVQNTYGLYLKGFSYLSFKNNSVHDNQKEVINNTPSIQLGGNFWGTQDPQAVMAKVQGPVDLAPLRSLKDILRTYLRTQLPVITKQMSLALAKKEKEEDRREALEMKKLRKEQAREKKALARQSQPAPRSPEAEAQAQPAVSEAQAPEEAAPEASSIQAPEEAVQGPLPSAPGGEGAAAAVPLAPAPYTLKPMTNLPPDQGPLCGTPAIPSTAGPVGAAPESSQPAPEAAQPAPAVQPAPAAPPPLPAAPEAVTAPPPAAPAPPAVSVPQPPEVQGNAPSASDMELLPPPVQEASPASGSSSAVPAPPATEAAPPAPEAPAVPPPPAAAASSVPQPPDLNEQIPPTAANPPAVSNPSPAPPAPPAAQPAPPPANVEPTQAQEKAVQSLQGVSGDIDGMQAPPLDLGPVLSTPATDGSAPASQSAPSTDSGLVLPPLQDTDVAPPKDLDLPPTDDLGNVNLDSQNK